MEKKDISSEQAFDMLPYVVDIYEKSNFDEFRKEIQKKYKGKKDVDFLEPAIEGVKYILKNSAKVKEEFFAVVAIAEERSIEDVKKQSLVKTIASIKNIFSNPELVDFFKQAM